MTATKRTHFRCKLGTGLVVPYCARVITNLQKSKYQMTSIKVQVDCKTCLKRMNFDEQELLKAVEKIRQSTDNNYPYLTSAIKRFK